MSQYTRQDIFNKVVEHLLSMTERCTATEKDNDSGIYPCRYRDKNNNKCAIGALIPDELYTSEIEDFSASYEPVLALLAKANYPVDQTAGNFYEDLQQIHDYKGHWNDDGLNRTGLNKLSSVASQWSLESPTSLLERRT